MLSCGGLVLKVCARVWVALWNAWVQTFNPTFFRMWCWEGRAGCLHGCTYFHNVTHTLFNWPTTHHFSASLPKFKWTFSFGFSLIASWDNLATSFWKLCWKTNAVEPPLPTLPLPPPLSPSLPSCLLSPHHSSYIRLLQCVSSCATENGWSGLY